MLLLIQDPSLTSALDIQQQNMLAALPIVASIEFQALQRSQGMTLKETIQMQSLLSARNYFSIVQVNYYMAQVQFYELWRAGSWLSSSCARP